MQIRNPQSTIRNRMVDGVVIIDKPAGWTSHDVVARVRRVLSERKVGHTGTLDPFATGVLVVLVGRATRLAQFVSGAEKEYEGVIRFGYATETGDSTGKPRPVLQAGGSVEEYSMTWGDHEIELALGGLRGQIEQVPPMYSAKKLKGRKLYELARRGEEVERAPVTVHIRELEAVRVDGALLRRNEDATCDLSVRVVCSAGTYIRALAESIGERLGVPAHLAALRRTRAGHFKIEDATRLDELSEMVAESTETGVLLPPDAALSELPFVHLTMEEARRTCHGMTLHVEPSVGAAYLDGEHVRMLDESGRLLAVGVYDARAGGLHPRAVLSPEK
ncbi:MAG TPA: tRNA pseudouridine(55) synthase TruB [Pyrinomonadaceae bacterium]